MSPSSRCTTFVALIWIVPASPVASAGSSPTSPKNWRPTISLYSVPSSWGALASIAGVYQGLIGEVTKNPRAVTGKAGSIALGTNEVPVEELRLDAGRIATSAGPAAGGEITIQATRLVELDHASEITASTGAGRGGVITIDPDLVLLKHGSEITAGANEGAGGFIGITADHFVGFPGTLVSAISQNQELSGTVEIHSPDVNLAGTLAELPTNFLDAASLMRERCAARKSGERVGSFAVRGAGGIPAEPDGWLPAPLLSDPGEATAASDPPILLASASGPLLLARGCP